MVVVNEKLVIPVTFEYTKSWKATVFTWPAWKVARVAEVRFQWRVM